MELRLLVAMNRTKPPASEDPEVRRRWNEKSQTTESWRNEAIKGTITYLEQSYWQAKQANSPTWTAMFWQIRDRFGEEFCNRLATAFLNVVVLEDSIGPSRSAELFKPLLERADARVDSESLKWPEIQTIFLQNHE